MKGELMNWKKLILVLIGALIVCGYVVDFVRSSSSASLQFLLIFAAFPVFAVLRKAWGESIGSSPAWVIGFLWIVAGMFWLDSVYATVSYDDITDLGHIMENTGYGYIGIRKYFEMASTLKYSFPLLCIVMMYNGYQYGGRHERAGVDDLVEVPRK